MLLAVMADAWEMLSREPKEPKGVLTDAFLIKYDIYLNWDALSAHYDFSLDMLRHYCYKVNWALVLKRLKLPESFLREMAPKFDDNTWSVVSKCQTLSNSFIHDYAAKLDWDYVLLYQDVNWFFLSQHKQYFDN